MRAAPAVSCARLYKEMRTRAYRFSGDSPASLRNGFTAYAVLSSATNSVVTVAAGLMAERSGWIISATGSLAPATGVGTTRFCRTQQRRSSSAPAAHQGPNSPCDHLARQRCRATASHPAFVTTLKRPSCRERMGELVELICPSAKAKYLLEGLDRILSRTLICPSGAGVGWAKALLRRAHHYRAGSRGWWHLRSLSSGAHSRDPLALPTLLYVSATDQRSGRFAAKKPHAAMAAINSEISTL